MKKETYAMYGDILREELLLAMGCTEPVAVAYAGAIARSVLDKPQSIRKCELYVSGNIIKNVKSVIVPNTDGMKGTGNRRYPGRYRRGRNSGAAGNLQRDGASARKNQTGAAQLPCGGTYGTQ